MTRPVSLYVPGSLSPAVPAVVDALAALDPPVEASVDRVAPSGALAAEILAGAPADVMISADAGYLAELVGAGLVAGAHRLAGNALCLIAHPDRAAEFGDARDLVRPGLRVAVFQHANDPCGQYTRRMFERIGIDRAFEEKEARGEVYVAPGGRHLPDAVRSGDVDAGVIYASWAASLGEGVTAIPLYGEQAMRDEIVFTIGALIDRSGRPRHEDGPCVVDFLTGSDGQSLLQSEGFLPAE